MSESNGCIPDLCSNTGFSDSEFCDVVKGSPMTLDQMYTGGRTIINEIPSLYEGLGDAYTSTSMSWILILGLSIFVPYIIIFVIIFLLLMSKNVISPGACVMFIVLVVILAVIGIIVIFVSSYYAASKIKNDTYSIVKHNWEKNKDRIMFNVGSAYMSPESSTCPIGVSNKEFDDYPADNYNSSLL